MTVVTTRRAKRTSCAARRRLQPAVRRSELLEAALRAFKDLGPYRARVEDVTRAAGAAKGTFYLYFASWNHLLVAVRDHVVSRYASDVRTRLAATESMDWMVIERECMRFIDFVVDLGELHEVIFHGPIADQPIGEDHSAIPLVAELLRAGIAKGACRSVDADMAAPLLFSTLHATADHITRSGDRESRTAVLLDLLRTWLRSRANEDHP